MSESESQPLSEPSVQIKVFGLRMKLWWSILIGLQSFIMMFILISLGTPYWVYIEGEPSTIVIPDVNEIQGGLLSVEGADD